jgi:hypothetical protein
MSKNTGRTVREILKGKRGAIRQALLEPNSPSWDDILNLTWEEVVEKAETDEPGFRTIKKLLGDKRFDK